MITSSMYGSREDYPIDTLYIWEGRTIRGLVKLIGGAAGI